MSGYLSELATGLGWDAKEWILMVWGYYDESGQYEGGRLVNMVTGGCMAPLENWLGFSGQWECALKREGLISFHMKEFERWNSPFDFKLRNGERDNEKHRRLLDALLDAIIDNVGGIYGFAAQSAYDDPKRAHFLSIEDGTIGAIAHAVNEAWEDYGEPVSLVFARQNHMKESHLREIAEIYDWGEGRGRLKSVSVANVEDICALQAADLIAYEMRCALRPRMHRRYPMNKLIVGSVARGIRMTTSWGKGISRYAGVLSLLRQRP